MAHRSRLALSVLTGVLVLADGALAALGVLVWDARRRGNLTESEAATSIVLGASAAAGALLLLIALIGLARGVRGHPAAQIASVLAWLRLAVVLVAPMVVAILLGLSAVAGVLETSAVVVAVVDALIGLLVTGVAVRRTRHG
jgi:hypothetical protein